MAKVSVEDKKAWLKQGLEIQNELQLLKDTRQKVYEDAISITGHLSAGRVSGGRKIHKFDKLTEIDDFITSQEKELVTRRAKLLKVIYSTKDSLSRMVLTYRYVDGYTWDDISQKMNYSVRQIHNLHSAALSQIRITPAMIEQMQCQK